MDLWGTIKDAGSLKDVGLDFGSLSTDLFGDNKITSGLNSLIDFGSTGANVDKQKEIEAEKKRREAETAKINSSYIPKMPEINIEKFDTKDYYIFGGIIAAVVFVVSIITRRK